MITVFENYGKDYLQKFFEDEGFNVDIFEQDNQRCAEIEKWTDGGVDMIITLMPFTKNEFIDYVNDFDVDDLINTHRQDENYKRNFTMAQSRKDFKKFHKDLKKTVKKMESKNFIMNQKASKYNI
jgi:hypothetical protein